MSWEFRHFQGGIMSVLDEMKDYLNGLSENSQRNAKCSASDQKQGMPRGVIFHNSDLPKQDFPSSGSWIRKTYKTSNRYDNDLFRPATEFLEALPIKEAYHAKVAFTNFRGSPATLTIWYRNE